MVYAVRVACLILAAVLSASTALGCEDPDPLPPVPFIWMPTCYMIRADAPDPVSVVPRVAAELLAPGPVAPQSPFSADVIHPLGFSPTGAFAYLETRSSADFSRWAVVVVDLKTDAVLGQLGEDSDDEESVFGDVAVVISLNRRAITEFLYRHQISVQSLDVHEDSFEREGQAFTVRIGEPITGNTGVRTSVSLDAPGLGSKRVGDLTQWTPCPMCSTPWARVVLSPWEPRAAIIVAFRGYRFESSLPAVHHEIFGAHLGDRFTKKTKTPR